MYAPYLHDGAAHGRSEELLNVQCQRCASVDNCLDLATQPGCDLGEDQAVEEGGGLSCSEEDRLDNMVLRKVVMRHLA